MIRKSTPRYISNRNVYLYSSKHTYENVHRGIICNSQNKEITQMQINSRTDK